MLCFDHVMSKTRKHEKLDQPHFGGLKVRLIEPEELTPWNVLVAEHHYLSCELVGPTLRYVAELDERWVGLISFGQAAYHLKHRDDWIGWTDVQRGRRLGLLAQNNRFVMLSDRGEYPNLASRILSMACKRLSADWEDRSPMKNHNAARVLATMKMVAIFLCEIKAHRPQSERECSLPEFHRSCSINAIDTVIN